MNFRSRADSLPARMSDPEPLLAVATTG